MWHFDFGRSQRIFELNRSSNIVCIGVRWNLLGQVGGTPGVVVYGAGNAWVGGYFGISGNRE